MQLGGDHKGMPRGQWLRAVTSDPPHSQASAANASTQRIGNTHRPLAQHPPAALRWFHQPKALPPRIRPLASRPSTAQGPTISASGKSSAATRPTAKGLRLLPRTARYPQISLPQNGSAELRSPPIDLYQRFRHRSFLPSPSPRNRILPGPCDSPFIHKPVEMAASCPFPPWAQLHVAKIGKSL